MLTLNATPIKTAKPMTKTVRQTASTKCCARPSFLILLLRALSAVNV